MHKVEAPVLPAIDDAFCKRLGIEEGGMPALRERMLSELENHAQQITREKAKHDLLDQLLTQHPVQLPKALVQQDNGFFT